ncbi:hypothetical protein N9R49_04650, partial [Gammaproteobacteria bacterium]|nr:hypothetical protein [Gammaproteobacteria bacterium]
LFELLQIDKNLVDKEMLGQKLVVDPYFSVDPNNTTPFPPELDDLCRLHYLVRTRKVTTILEFGIGKSTYVLDDALKRNEMEFGPFVKENLRRSNPFELHSIDNYQEWIDSVKSQAKPSLSKSTFLHFCDLNIGTFNDRMCTFYEGLPNISPDFIYLDGPDQFSAKGSVRGLSTRHPDSMPMAADILTIEHFLVPGTLIVVDGRAANARFLKSNLQREWTYSYFPEYDQHFFELLEEPLGRYNKDFLDFVSSK